MRMLLAISWRNIWRHPARSGALLGAIVAGLCAGILVGALTNGWIQQRFTNLIREEVTHAQVHHPEFLAEREPWLFLEEADAILGHLDRDDRVRSYAARTLADGMIQSPLTSAGVQIRGVLADRERATTTFHENLFDGDYLDSEVRHPILLGQKLAEKLNTEIGQRVVLTFQDLDNEITSGAFHIVGIFKSASTPYDERHVFVRSEDLSELLVGRPIYHEIAMILEDDEQSAAVTADLNDRFSGISAETWYELSPELRWLTEAGGSIVVYIMVIIMLALAFGILNTMLMAIFERMRELGMLMAIGMSKLRIFLMIMLESVILSASGAIVGLALAHLLVVVLGRTGIDLSSVGGESMAEFGFEAVVFPVAYREDYVNTMVLVVATAILAAVYPAIKALRLRPGEAVRD